MKKVKCIDPGQGLNIKKNEVYEVVRIIPDGFDTWYELRGVVGRKLKDRFKEVGE